MMKTTVSGLASVVVLAVTLGLAFPVVANAQSARARYEAAQAREATLRRALDKAGSGASAAVRKRLLANARKVGSLYELVVHKYPRSGYSDNALFNAASIADAVYELFEEPRDRQAALRLYRRVSAEYPSTSLKKKSASAIAQLERSAERPAPTVPDRARPTDPVSSAPADEPRARLVGIERTALPEGVRITLALDREVAYREETLNGPPRVFFDLKDVEAAPEFVDAVLRYPSDVVRQIRVGRHPDSTVRVVLDLDGVSRHSAYALYNPFRVVIDCESTAAAASAALGGAGRTAEPRPEVSSAPSRLAPPTALVSDATPAVYVPPPAASTASGVDAAVMPPPPPPVPARVTTPAGSAVPPPEAPNANRAGGFSIARQLGLGVSRIVIDAGHGGRDPGAHGKGLNEADLTLDIALRLEKLLQDEPALEVVLTRRTNVYIPLEERTAIANREDADLFLSIHANASRNVAARGVETYFLSFAATPEAEAVAARENSAHAGEMHNLPDIIKAIALNNKLDESRDLAGMVQEALVTRLRRSNKNVRNLGVKKAPFVVLIGAGMPSVLAEVSFLTNKQELRLLQSASYKQRIAEALHAAVMRYRRSLKGKGAIASQ